MRNIRLLIEYDGSRYDGWQRLGKSSGSSTIQGRIEAVASRMVGAPVEIIGSGRTDAGVHAYGQVANFHAETDLSCEAIRDYFNRYLPEDIGIREVYEAKPRFHSRLNAVSKKYLYRIVTGNAPCVFDRRYVCRCPESLDTAAMERAAAYLVGRHDFKAFSSVKRPKKSTVRELYRVDIFREHGELRLMFCGSGFLYHMVRIMSGTLMEVGMGKRKPEEIPQILAGRDRTRAGVTAPPQGLFLYEVSYEPDAL